MDELGRALLQFIYEGAQWMEELLAEEAARWQISAAEAKISSRSRRTSARSLRGRAFFTLRIYFCFILLPPHMLCHSR